MSPISVYINAVGAKVWDGNTERSKRYSSAEHMPHATVCTEITTTAHNAKRFFATTFVHSVLSAVVFHHHPPCC